MLKYGEINPLAVFGLRELEHCPPHFTVVDFDIRTSEKTITDWIWSNLTGRFWMGDYYFKTDSGSVSMNKRVGFEIPGEATMFTLILDQINKFES